MTTSLPTLLDGCPQSPLFSTYGMSTASYDNEGRTVDAFLWVVRHCPAMATAVLGRVPEGNVAAYPRPTMPHHGERPTPDAIITDNIGGICIEAKIGPNKIDHAQCSNYRRACVEYGIEGLLTISNETAVNLPLDEPRHAHVPWARIVAEAQWLAATDDTVDACVSEFVAYAASGKVGINEGPVLPWAETWSHAASIPDEAQRDVLLDAVRKMRELSGATFWEPRGIRSS